MTTAEFRRRHSRSARCCAAPSPRRLLPWADTTTASARRAASKSSLRSSAAALVVRAPISPSETASVMMTATLSSDRHPRARSAALPIAAPAPLRGRHDDGERAPSREHVVVAIERRRPRRACDDRAVGNCVRHDDRNAEFRSASSRPFCCSAPSPRRLLSGANTTTASARRTASTSSLRSSAAALVVRAPISPSETACVMMTATPCSERHPRDLSAALPHRRAGSSQEPTRRRRARAEPRARRRCDRAPPTSSCVRRSRRRKPRES